MLFQNRLVAPDVRYAVGAAANDVLFAVMHMILCATDCVVVLDNLCAVMRAASLAAARIVVRTCVFEYVVCFVDVTVSFANAVAQNEGRASFLFVEYLVLFFCFGELSFRLLQIRFIAAFVQLLQ